MSIGFYQVRPGDELYRILRAHYGDAAFLRDREAVVRLILESNPDIKDPDRIYPGQIVVLPPSANRGIHSHSNAPSASAGMQKAAPFQFPSTGSSKGVDGELPRLAPSAKSACGIIKSKLTTVQAPEQDFIGSINMYDAALTGSGNYFDFVKKTAHAAQEPIREIIGLHGMKSAGILNKGQYDYQRSKRIKAVESKLGPLHRLINPSRKPGEVLRVAPHAADKLAAHSDQIRTLGRIGRAASRGNVVLGVIDLGVTATAIRTAESDKERTIIVAEKAGGLAGSAAVAGIALMVVSGPLGWVGLLTIATASTVMGVAGGMAAKHYAEGKLYDDECTDFDLKSDKAWQWIHRRLAR
ncbi:LysM peptidoglycan-binding domain-containing protein [Jiella pacifica]|uniref:LysM peptidoglycan-binding domain-containing protein n=1 Tax=Jiella pacifica TaxID=2696469 RepID=A0A6N9T039_9HYPH|nr:LysM peptidoglycan-binding domain-containing protein [Jiella pacifica]NDW04461.1 LysM peptidoglycan-binding domain-containing protein [Jiella pacifica]